MISPQNDRRGATVLRSSRRCDGYSVLRASDPECPCIVAARGNHAEVQQARQIETPIQSAARSAVGSNWRGPICCPATDLVDVGLTRVDPYWGAMR
jgi:hypothetical protein